MCQKHGTDCPAVDLWQGRLLNLQMGGGNASGARADLISPSSGGAGGGGGGLGLGGRISGGTLGGPKLGYGAAASGGAGGEDSGGTGMGVDRVVGGSGGEYRGSRLLHRIDKGAAGHDEEERGGVSGRERPVSGMDRQQSSVRSRSTSEDRHGGGGDPRRGGGSVAFRRCMRVRVPRPESTAIHCLLQPIGPRARHGQRLGG